jgi:dipeptidyl-peptidase 4
MKKFALLFLCFASVSAQNTQFSLDSLWKNAYAPKRLESIHSMNNGKQYTVLEKDFKTRSSKIVLHDFLKPENEEVIVATDNKQQIPFFESYAFSKNEEKILLATEVDPIYRRSEEAIYWVFDRTTGKATQLFDQKIQEPLLSPDATQVAFVYRRNLFLKDLNTGNLSQLTEDGDFQTLNGITDWVYEEEFGFVRAFDWSPDSKQIVYMRFDESEVPIFSMDIFGKELYPYPYMFRYPKAGEPNSKVELWLYDLPSKGKKRLDFGAETPYYIPRIKFAGGAHSLIIQTLNRHQNNLKVWRWNTASNALNVMFEENDAAYVSIHDDMNFLDDGTFLWTSERDGYNHIYHYDGQGKLLSQVTQGPWEVTALHTYNPKTKEIFYQSVEGSSTDRGLYAIQLNGKGKRTLHPTRGFNGATFSKGGMYYIHSYSDETTPPKYSLYLSKNNKRVRALLNNDALIEKTDSFGFSNKEFSTLEVNGEQLNMWMIKPTDFDPAKKYPLLMFQYSGPGSQQVANRWGSGQDWWHKSIADRGYIIACVDGRGTGLKGAAFKKVTYLNLVKYEAQDQIEAAKKLGALSYVDESRIGIWGWSFGGHMASHCLLTGNDFFSMAIAVAPVTNWRFYDTIYTERFMRTPQENPDGYDLNSPINYADQLKGKFLIIHGSGDDNVHVQNTLRMVEALIQADKQFEWMIYPDKNHGIYGGNTRNHLYSKMTNFIFENL